MLKKTVSITVSVIILICSLAAFAFAVPVPTEPMPSYEQPATENSGGNNGNNGNNGNGGNALDVFDQLASGILGGNIGDYITDALGIAGTFFGDNDFLGEIRQYVDAILESDSQPEPSGEPSSSEPPTTPQYPYAPAEDPSTTPAPVTEPSVQPDTYVQPSTQAAPAEPTTVWTTPSYSYVEPSQVTAQPIANNPSNLSISDTSSMPDPYGFSLKTVIGIFILIACFAGVVIVTLRFKKRELD